MIGGRGQYGDMSKPKKVGDSGLKSFTTQQFTPEQMDLYNQLFGNVGPDSYLDKLAGGDQDTFNEIESPALQQFASQQGNIASRFSGQGVGGRNSSAHQLSQTSAASNFAQQLQSQRSDLMRQARMDLHGMSQDLLGQRPYETNYYEPQKKKSGWESFAAGALPIAGAAVGGIFGGPAGAYLGGSAGSAASRGFFS